LISWGRRGRWLLLAAIPSGLLSAVTTVLATDLVSMPLIWVVPLAFYLVSLAVAFSRRAGGIVRAAAVATPAVVTLLWVAQLTGSAWPVLVMVPLVLIGFLVITTGLHGRLTQDRPHRAFLTDFYLSLTVGAASGSALVAVVAPAILPDLWEYPILLIGALVALALGDPLPRRSAGIDFGPFFAGLPARLVPYLVVVAILTAVLLSSGSSVLTFGVAWLAIGGLVLLFGGRRWLLVMGTTIVLVLAAFVLQPTEFRGRSYFGITRVLRSTETGLTVLVSGTTVHGSQWIDSAKHDVPTAYYGESGPAADLFEVGAAVPATGAANVGVVGLGTGALSAYAEAFTAMTYFEIDPVVVRIAQDPALFTYLADAPGEPRIVLGDGRRSLAAEPDGTFDLLVLDAFSSNAVPIHLLTTEAIGDAIRTLKPDGIIGFHVSNRLYDLAPPIAAALAERGQTTLERSGRGDLPGELPSRWLAASHSSERLDALRALGWTTVTPADHPFTDDYADLLSYLRLGF
jgi:SAM-dependent methyltransferase